MNSPLASRSRSARAFTLRCMVDHWRSCRLPLLVADGLIATASSHCHCSRPACPYPRRNAILRQDAVQGRNDHVSKAALADGGGRDNIARCQLTTSRAASREFCEEYARAAILQVRGGLSNRGCIGGMGGARWSAEYLGHFDWWLCASF